MTGLLPELVIPLAYALGVILFITANALFLIWMERKVSAAIQMRRGPIFVGPMGLLQTLADAVKLLSKELTSPSRADNFLFVLAPAMVFAPVLGSFLVLPFDRAGIIRDLNIGVLLVFALSNVAFLGIFVGGWASNNKYSALGALRAVAQNIAYEIPLILSALGVFLIAGSLKTSDIIRSQEALWFIALQPVACLIFFISMLGESNRAPFDIPEAESELVAGFHTEYSGMRFAIFMLSEYTHIFIGSAVLATLFLGGPNGPWIPGPAWFLLKVYGIIFVVMWVRWTFPRLRSDQLIHFSWKILIPLSLVHLIVTAWVYSFVKGYL